MNRGPVGGLTSTSRWSPGLKAIIAATLLGVTAGLQTFAGVPDELTPLPGTNLKFNGGLDDFIQNSLNHWNKGVVPYGDFVQMFRGTGGKRLFAEGEMWGKAVRSGSMMFRYTRDPELKRMLEQTVADLLTTKRSNGSISCAEVAQQPAGSKGDLWERKYVLLGLEGFYQEVEQDPAVLQAMVDEADCTLAQIGPPPKVPILDQGWSPNHIESSTILEPILRLYNLTGHQRYLDFATYIVKEGGARGDNVFEEAFSNEDPEKIGGPVYPKAYEMMSLFEGLTEYYRVTGHDHWKQAVLNLYHHIRTQEITLIGNGGADQPWHPAVLGEAWDYTAREQTNPDIKRMMETCSGVTWLKLCSQIVRLTGDPQAMDEVEKYAYNGLIGAMKPGGDGFSYVNLLNGVKTNPHGWGLRVDTVDVTCCNLNGPMGLAYLPYVAVMQARTGPVINLYNAGSATALTPRRQPVELALATDYPKSGRVVVTVKLPSPEKFILKMRIPGWSAAMSLTVNGRPFKAAPGTYAALARRWKTGDTVTLNLDLRCRLIPAPHGSNRLGDNYQALVRGPIVLARDENLDPHYNQPVALISQNGYVEVTPEPATLTNTWMQFSVPTSAGRIPMVDYATVNNWNGKHICTWLPTLKMP